MQKVEKKRKDVEEIIEILKKTNVGTRNSRVNEVLIKKRKTYKRWYNFNRTLQRPEVIFADIKYIAELITGINLEGYNHDTEYQIKFV